MNLQKKFNAPIPVKDTEMAFGGNMAVLLPSYSELPEEFRSTSNKWCKIQQRWFFSGLPKDTDFLVKEGVDMNLAFRHIKAIHASWEPKHEHKEAGVAYLLSLWFDDIIIPENTEVAQ